jgi:hypothetical protein
MADIAITLLLFAIYPLWVLAGLADWACHRATRIEATSGLPENAFHWAMFAQMGVAVMLVLVCDVTGGLLAAVLGLWLLHQATVWAELRFTLPRRAVGPLEQMVHSLLEVLPLAGVLLLAAAHAQQAGDAGVRLRTQPLPFAVVAGVLGASLVLNVLPLAEETWRCLRARRGA